MLCADVALFLLSCSELGLLPISCAEGKVFPQLSAPPVEEKGSCGTPLEFSPGPTRRGCRGRRNPTAACCSPTCITLGRRQPHFPGRPLPEAFDQGTAPCVLLRAEPTFPVTLPSLHGWCSVCIRAPHPRGFMFPLRCSFWFREALCWGCLKIW